MLSLDEIFEFDFWTLTFFDFELELELRHSMSYIRRVTYTAWHIQGVAYMGCGIYGVWHIWGVAYAGCGIYGGKVPLLHESSLNWVWGI